jgi:hypothetical protein
MSDIGLSLLNSISGWKTIHGSVYYVKISGSEYVFRPLKKNEYLSILSLQATAAVDSSEMLLSTCLLYPAYDADEFDAKLAGEVDSLVNCVNDISGFSDIDNFENTLEKARLSLGTLDNQITILICKAFPHLTLLDINNLTYEELVRYIAISESILDVKLNIEKPKQNKNGTIDFEKENREMGEKPPAPIRPVKSRGDARKLI